MSIEPSREPLILGLGALKGAEPPAKDSPETQPPSQAPKMQKLFFGEGEQKVGFDPATGMFIGGDFPTEEPTLMQKASSQWRMLGHYADSGLSTASHLINQCLGVRPKAGTFNPATGQFE